MTRHWFGLRMRASEEDSEAISLGLGECSSQQQSADSERFRR